MLELDLTSRVDLPAIEVLQALAERCNDGMLVFREDGAVALSSPYIRQLLQSDGGALLQLDKQMLLLTRESGSWNGSLPIGERVVIAHLTHYAHHGVSWYLALVHEIECHKDY